MAEIAHLHEKTLLAHIDKVEKKPQTKDPSKFFYVVSGYIIETTENFSGSSFHTSFEANTERRLTFSVNGKYLNIEPAAEGATATPPPAEEPKEEKKETPPPVENKLAEKPKEPEWKRALRTAEAKFMAVAGVENKAKIELGFAVQLMETNPDLKQCTPDSLVNAIVNVARMDTTLNPALKLAHLVPRNNNKKKVKECSLVIDYKGLVKILKDNKCLKFFDAIIVYSDEKFEPNMAPNQPPRHERNIPISEQAARARTVVGLYGRVVMMDDTMIYTDLMPFWEVEKALKVSFTDSIQKAWPEEMWKKTKLRRDFKLLIAGNPSEQVLAAMEVEGENTFATSPEEVDSINSLIEAMKDAATRGDETAVKKIWQDNQKFHTNMDFVNANAEAWDVISELNKQASEQPA